MAEPEPSRNCTLGLQPLQAQGKVRQQQEAVEKSRTRLLSYALIHRAGKAHATNLAALPACPGALPFTLITTYWRPLCI